MKTNIKTNYLDTFKKILEVVNLLIRKSSEYGNNIGHLSIESVREIINGLNSDKSDISGYNKNYIQIEEFKDNELFYDILYRLLLNKIYKYGDKITEKIVLFKTFNQFYFYKKCIKYISEFINKYPEYLSDDLIKEKLFEIVHSLGSDDKLYHEDFYFYISMYHIHYNYKREIQIPAFEIIPNKLETDNNNTILSIIKEDKMSVIRYAISMMKLINSKSPILGILNNVKKDINKSIIFKKIDDETDENSFKFDNIKWEELITESEKIFAKYLKDNSENEDVKKLYKDFDEYIELKDKLHYYYKDMMESFMSLTKEEKYIFINSFNYGIKFHTQCSKFKSLKDSYDKSMKKNELKERIKTIIEDKNYYKHHSRNIEIGKNS